MKKAILLFVAAFSFLLSVASAENFLILTNPVSHEANVFRKGSYLVYELKADGSRHEGFIVDITDSSIVFDYSEVPLSQMNVFAGRTRSKIVAGRIANAVGSTLVFTGSTVFDCGSEIICGTEYYYWPIGGTVWLAGACIAGLGYAFDWALNSPGGSMRVRNYSDWMASIVREGQQIPGKQISRLQDTTQTTPVPAEPPKGKKKKNVVSGDDVYGQ